MSASEKDPLLPSNKDTSIQTRTPPDAVSQLSNSGDASSEQRQPFDISGRRLTRRSSELAQAHLQRLKLYSRLAPANKPNSIIMPAHVLPDSIFVIGLPKGGEQSSYVTILSLWNTMMGTSVLAMPWAISQAGFALGLLCIVIMCGLALYTCQIVLASGQGGRMNGTDVEFIDVCLHYLGKKAYIVAMLFSVLTLVGACMVYWVLMSSFLYTSVDYFHAPGNHTDEGTWGDYWNTSYVPLYLVIIVFPLLNFKSLSFFTRFNSLGIVSIVYILFFVVYAAANGGSYDNSPVGGINFDHQTLFSSNFVSFTGVLALSFFIHNGVLSIMRNQRNPENNARDLNLAYLFVALTYTIVGVIYYLAYKGDKTKINNNFLLDFKKDADNFLFALLADVFLFIQMLTVFPLLMYIVRFQVLTALFNGKEWPGTLHVVVLNLMVTTCCVLIAVFYPSIGTILRYTGAFSGLVYLFALPALTKMEMQRRKGELTVWSKIFHYGLILIGLLNVIGQFLVSS
ncbi:hypothetical protein PTSG_11963 [Salpingoeca rosetta]|uniref:Amino acid transporter transmembrane domain-containing protein n=1 Tax=Salpingoeca rosetta (strain ATCC 50818 / BSB-021) TaxID=946362 RepID=F2U467_SALR5|nr:uncharacterized protein PTSG_11963 [Salpingoeca rosetta]EGD82433.1 hypothetical protein PTSG_11963 [Salpingoeca rosetta]|eukprot:XP_004995669.1 hypothetical protein PTSG_11963 [Salpingoeca rosetta]